MNRFDELSNVNSQIFSYLTYAVGEKIERDIIAPGRREEYNPIEDEEELETLVDDYIEWIRESGVPLQSSEYLTSLTNIYTLSDFTQNRFTVQDIFKELMENPMINTVFTHRDVMVAFGGHLSRAVQEGERLCFQNDSGYNTEEED